MNANQLLKRSILIIAGLTGMMFTQAQDRIFTYTYQSNVLNKGQNELESWHTIRTGRDDFYVRYDNRTEYEIGLGSNLQTAFYLNLGSKTVTITSDSIKSLSTSNNLGFSNEWKFKVLDPVANVIGLALYGEVGISTDEIEVEGKIIVDKKIGIFTIAFNGVYEQEFTPEYKNQELEWETEQKLDGYLAFACFLGSGFHLTQENALKNVFDGGQIAHSVLYSGIGFSYSMDKFWVNFTAMPQITSFNGATNNNLNLNEYEKIQFRLLFSFML